MTVPWKYRRGVVAWLMTLLPLAVVGWNTTPLDVKHIGLAEGLGNQCVSAIAEDGDGVVWIATKTFIDRYNGRTIRHYSLPGDYGYGDRAGRRLGVCYDSRYGLWAFDMKGNISRYSPRQDRFELYLGYEANAPHGDEQMHQLAIDADGVLWIALSSGLYKSERAGERQAVRTGRRVNDVLVAGDSIYAATTDGLWSASRSGSLTQWTERAKGAEIQSLCLTDDGRELWMGVAERGLQVLNLQTGTLCTLHTAEAAWENPIRSIVDYDGEQMLVGIDGGGVFAVRRDRGESRLLLSSDAGNAHALRGNGIYAVMKDHQHGIWVGSYTGGVSMAIVPRHPLITLAAERRGPWQLADNNVNDIEQTRSGALWLATDQGITISSPDGEQPARHVLKEVVALTLAESNDGRVWLGTYGDGIWLLDAAGRPLKHLTKQNGLTTNYVFSIRQQADGDLWIGGMGGRLLHTDAEGRTKESFDIEWVNSIEIADNGEVGVATVNGFYLIHPQTHTIRCYATAQELSGQKASAYMVTMAFEDDQTVWLGTEGGGLMRYDLTNQTFRTLTTDDGLPSDDIYGLHRDEEGNLWVSTGGGLAKLDREMQLSNLNYIGDVNKAYNKSSLARLADGRLAFGSTDGAVILTPAATDGAHYQAPLRWTGVNIEDAGEEERQHTVPLFYDMLQQGRVSLGYGQRSFTVTFEAINHLFQRDICYSWMMEGYDKNWSTPSDIGLARYLQVAPGSYRLKVRVLRRSDGSVTDEQTLQLRVASPWWATGWMYCCYVLTLAGVVYFVIRYQMNRLQKRHDEEKIRLFIHTAHDIRTPVSLIAAPLEDLSHLQGLPREATQLVEIAHAQTSKLHALISRLLEFEKTEAMGRMQSPSPISLSALLTKEVEGFRTLCQHKHITLSLQLPDETLCVWAERNLLEMLTDNLLSNACKYTPEQGRIEVRLGGNRQKVWMEVSDTGVGIPKKYHKQLFRNPFRAGNVQNLQEVGTGFGLLQVGRIVKILGGHISLRSEENRGATFTLTFPRCHQSPAESLQPEVVAALLPEGVEEGGEVQPVEATADAAYTLLIVEDHEELRSYLSRTFRREYRVVEASDGEQALQCLQGEYPDLVISDVMMPGMDGDELCRRLKSDPDTAGIPVILLTAKADHQSVVEGLKSGADDYMPKPFSTEVLRLKVKGLIENRNRLRSYLLQQALQQADSSPLAASGVVEVETPTEEERVAQPAELSESDRRFIDRATRLVLDHLADTDFSIDQLCREMAMSRTLFFNRLKSLTGQGPQEFIRMLRLQRAAELLKEGRSVADVAIETGFVNSKYFSSLFKKHFGVQPSRYAEQ